LNGNGIVYEFNYSSQEIYSGIQTPVRRVILEAVLPISEKGLVVMAGGKANPPNAIAL
jgi:hypothetical protein